MRRKPLNLTVKKQIKKEIRRYLKRIHNVRIQSTNTQYDAAFLPEAPALEDKLETLIIPILSMLTNQRIISGGLPTQITPDSLKLYIHPMLVGFGENNIFAVQGEEITLQTFLDDRWVYVYIDDEGEFIVNKYSPVIGANSDRIPICRVWIEHDATSYNLSLLRDLRPVGVASANLNHVLRQTFLNLMHAMPSVLDNFIEINPHTKSGDAKLYVYVNANDNNAVFGNLTPLPEVSVEIPQPPSGSKTYILIAQATIDSSSPDDLKFLYVVKEEGTVLENYDIPIALIRDVTSIQTEIQSDQIETFGIQKKKDDFYAYDLNFDFEDMPTNATEAGAFEITEHTIDPASTYTHEIQLKHSDFKMGQLILYVPNGVRLSSNRRITSFIMFTTELNDTIARAGGRSNYNIYGCNFTDRWTKGFYYKEDSKLSDVYHYDDGGQAGLRGQLRIESCQIVGDKIELKFRNTHGTHKVRITIKGRFLAHV